MIAPKNAVFREVLEKYNTGVEVTMPDLVEIQLNSYERFLQTKKLKSGEPVEKLGLEEVFHEVFPIESSRGNFVLDYHSYQLEFSAMKYTERECVDHGISYAIPLKIKVSLYHKETGEFRERELYLGDIPLMTERGTFIINGAERVVVSQIHRSPGIVFEEGVGSRGKEFLIARIIPYRGSWLEFEVDNRKNVIWVKIDKNTRILATLFLRILGFDTRKKILEAFYPETDTVTITPENKSELEGRVLADDVVVHREESSYCKSAGEKLLLADVDDFIEHGIKTITLISGINTAIPADRLLISCLEQESVKYQNEGETEPNITTICSVISEVLKMSDRYEEARVQQEINNMFFNPKRYDLGRVGRFKLNKKFNYKEDITAMTLLPDDFINAMKFLIKLHKGEERVDDIDHLGNRRVRAVGELVALEFKKAMSRMAKNARDKLALKERRSDIRLQDLFTIKPILSAVKDFFCSSQLCQFMDQVNPLAALTHKRRINALGPGGLSRERAGFDVRDVHYSHYGRVCPIESPEGPNIGLIMSLTNYSRVNDYGFLESPYRKVVNGKVTDKIEYLTAMEEDYYYIAQSDVPLNVDGTFTQQYIPARKKGDYITCSIDEVQYMDASPKQIVSVSTSLIPFLEHDDANRALMGSNMQRQAVPLLYPEPPRVGTGMERKAAYDSGVVIIAKRGGVVTHASAETIEITPENSKNDDKDIYSLIKYKRTNHDTCFIQKSIVELGQTIQEGEVIADGQATKDGELALGRNVLVGILPWNGYNFEDAIIVSEKLVKEDVFTSIHIKEFKLEVHDTRQGMETITNDIPNAPERMLAKLDENGIVRIGSKVQSNDILVGKITPKMDSEIEPERRLITQIFGEKGQEVQDTSLRLPHGVEGTVIDVRRISRKDGSTFSVGVEEEVTVLIAAKRRLKEGDKMAGRHGNKGVVARIVPEEDMPFMDDGTRLDICLSPLGIPSRMNIGQLLETELGWAATKLGKWFATPVFQSVLSDKIKQLLKEASLSEDSKVTLYDGRTGDKLLNPVMVGCMYILKLNHLVDEKMHARCTGSYSLVTQQPLGGKAQFGGQRLGEMEVWALEAYGAAHTLNEFITVKSDDLQGRLKIYESIVKGRNYTSTGVPESFRVLMHEMRGLGIDVTVYDKKGKNLPLTERDREIIKKREESF